jgi:hypothetical protein
LLIFSLANFWPNLLTSFLLLIGFGLVLLGFFGAEDAFFFGLSAVAFLDFAGFFSTVFFAALSFLDSVVLSAFFVVFGGFLTAFSGFLVVESVFLVALEANSSIGGLFTFFFQWNF